MSRSQSALFSPLTIGALPLAHRVILAPLTRNRAAPSKKHPHTYVPGALNAEYYAQRTTRGGLLISEGTAVNLKGAGVPGIPGLFTEEQIEGWTQVTDAVHAKGGLIVAQLWHAGRTTHSSVSSLPPQSSSAVPITDSAFQVRNDAADLMEPQPFETPLEMTCEDIKRVQTDYVEAAKNALRAGFDGIEIHAANGYLIDQFHHSNVNRRDDAYGGDIWRRSRFTIELAQLIGEAIGLDRVGVRLAPFGYFNQTRGDEREAQWTYLCSELSRLGVAYVHLIEPRFDEIRSEQEKLATLEQKDGLSEAQISLKPYRAALGKTPCIVAGGYNPQNCWDGIERGEHDAIAFGRYFCSNGDLVDRLRDDKPLYHYNRSRFYGPFADQEIGYTVHPEQKEQ